MKPIIGFALVAQMFLAPTIQTKDTRPLPESKAVEFAVPEKAAPLPVPQALKTPSKPVSIQGSKYDWLKASGIPESAWTYVDYIIQHESGWRPDAVNKSSGACGLPQALPCSKLGKNWSDPAHSLGWANNYALSRYGSWYQAYQHWLRNSWW